MNQKFWKARMEYHHHDKHRSGFNGYLTPNFGDAKRRNPSVSPGRCSDSGEDYVRKLMFFSHFF